MRKFKIQATVHKTNVVLRIFDGAKITKFLYIMSYSFCELSIKIKVPLNAVGVIIRSDGTRIEMN